MQKLFILFIAIWTMILPISAQETTEEAQMIEAPIQFAAFTMTSPEMSGIYPADWNEVQVGAYVRDDAENTTYILHLAETEASVEELIEPIRLSMQLDDLPEAIEKHESSMLEWTIYSFEYNPSELENETLSVDLATAEDEHGAYIILLQTSLEDYKNLHEQVFLLTLDAFGLDLETIVEQYNIITLENVTIANFGMKSAVPINWKRISDNSFMRSENEADITTLLLQSSAEMNGEELASLLLESLNLPVELPEPEITYETEYLSWSLHLIKITAQGTDIVFQIALAQEEELAYLVVLLSLSEEVDNLLDTVLLPLLDTTKASDS